MRIGKILSVVGVAALAGSSAFAIGVPEISSLLVSHASPTPICDTTEHSIISIDGDEYEIVYVSGVANILPHDHQGD